MVALAVKLDAFCKLGGKRNYAGFTVHKLHIRLDHRIVIALFNEITVLIIYIATDIHTDLIINKSGNKRKRCATEICIVAGGNSDVNRLAVCGIVETVTLNNGKVLIGDIKVNKYGFIGNITLANIGSLLNELPRCVLWIEGSVCNTLNLELNVLCTSRLDAENVRSSGILNSNLKGLAVILAVSTVMGMP